MLKASALLIFHTLRIFQLMRVSVAFRGRLSFRQYMPAKPTKYGAALCKVDCFKSYHS